jgi:hypothetical protein
MTTRICLILVVLLGAVPVWCQATGTDEDEETAPTETMKTPPPVSGQAYPTATGEQVRVNFLTLGLTTEVAYDDNLLAGYATTSQGAEIYSIFPTVTLDRSTLALRAHINYSPGFTFYEPDTAYNEADQNLTTNLQYRVGTNVSLAVQDSLVRSSSLYSGPSGSPEGEVTGGAPIEATGAVALFADRISNTASVQLNDQISENAMFGVSGQYGLLDYPNPSQVPGLYNSTSWAGAAFCSQHISSRQYLGANFQHVRDVSYLKGTDSEVESDDVFGFYTIYLRSSQTSTLSVSVTGGPEHYTAAQYPEASLAAWTPSGTVGIGWQGHLSSFAASYSRTVTGGGGLPGAYGENATSAFYRRELTPAWELDFTGFYAVLKNDTPLYAFSDVGGHTVTGTASVMHSITRDLKFQIGYDRMEMRYDGIGALTKLPNSDREFGSLIWQFNRPMGR